MPSILQRCPLPTHPGVPLLLQLGDYFASAQLSNAPPPPPDVIGRAVGAEGVCCCISGVLGTTTGSSAYAGKDEALQESPSAAASPRSCVVALDRPCMVVARDPNSSLLLYMSATDLWPLLMLARSHGSSHCSIDWLVTGDRPYHHAVWCGDCACACAAHQRASCRSARAAR